MATTRKPSKRTQLLDGDGSSTAHNANGSRPKLVYTIIESKNSDRSFWVRIGRAFVNRDESLTVLLNALPVNGRLHIREPCEEFDGDGLPAL